MGSFLLPSDCAALFAREFDDARAMSSASAGAFATTMMGVPSAANVTDAELAMVAVTVSSPPACRVPCVGGRNENNSNTGTITQDHVIDEAERLVASLPPEPPLRDHQPALVR